MSLRLVLLLGILGGVLATVAVLGLREIAGWPAALLGLFAGVGCAMAVAVVLGVTEVGEGGEADADP